MIEYNPHDITKLNENTVRIFRDGIELRQHQVDKLFGKYVRPETYPDFLAYGNYGSIKGKTKDFGEFEYSPKRFEIGCRVLYDLYPNSEKLNSELVNNLNLFEFRSAVFSGYLKHDSRGYYFDTSLKARFALEEVREGGTK